MKTKFLQRGAMCLAFFFVMSGIWALDVSIKIPEIAILGGVFEDFEDPGLDTAINTQLGLKAREFEAQITEDPTISKFSDQSELAEGFANAGSASSFSGLFRIPHSYKIFSAAYGFGVGASIPEVDFLKQIDSPDFINEKGDVYAGIALHPVNLSLGINLGFLVSGLKANVKFGYFDLPSGGIVKDVGFNSLSLGVGASYELLKPRSLAVGLIKWEGIVASTGFFYQRNRAEMSFTPDDQGFKGGTSITLGDIGIDPGGASGMDANTEFGVLSTTPKINAKIESSTFTIPLELSTAVRVLYVLELMAGAGVDLAFGSSEIGLNANADVDFVVNPALKDHVTVTPGEANLSNKTTSSPQLFRPRIMTGVGLGAGPIKLEFPFVIYFDSAGNTYVTGVTAGFML